ncbi:hypothetical protein HIM_03597 [Hirsutella minnesotensis 3608]|uniref:Small-subunit processome Utp12 domain-containing protein n=1 Tax=Hirsutella minnesotensis 3608 TaxID=1043627 RepID=A0A0F7ZMI7_9HYPO|nr:hypothetical protein HIM_03597 [Hirsutella minnesotensis 3608]
MSTKRKAPAKLANPVAQTAAKVNSRSIIDESKTSVSAADVLQSSQVETIEISSDDDSDEDISDAEETAAANKPNGDRDAAQPDSALARINGKPAAPSKPDAEESDGEPISPSFGELLRENDAIDVPTMLLQAGTPSHAAVTRPRAAIIPPSHQSLATVLSQALRTDDHELLESCLHTTDLSTIRNTIERLDSSLAGGLLIKLAARLYRRPGRAGSLMTWVQWTLIAHGGALASQPKVTQSLNSLQKVLAERAKGLNSLLALKGKLDLLECQMDLRRKIKKDSGLLHSRGGADDDEDVVWVEGETLSGEGKGSRRKQLDTDSDDDVPGANGFVGDSDDDEVNDSQAEEIDDSDDAEPLDEDEVDHDDVDESMGEEEESDVETGAPPTKAQKLSRSSAPRRK